MLRNYSAGSIYNSWLGVLENASQTTQQNLLLLRGMETPPHTSYSHPTRPPLSFPFCPSVPKTRGTSLPQALGCWGARTPPPPNCSSEQGQQRIAGGCSFSPSSPRLRRMLSPDTAGRWSSLEAVVLWWRVSGGGGGVGQSGRAAGRVTREARGRPGAGRDRMCRRRRSLARARD